MTPSILFQAFSFLAGGLILGSFFNVLIHRLPKGESILFPGSHCPQCKRPVRAYENIPVLSYLLLGGRCAGCKKKISIQYPLIEGATGCLSLVIWYFIFQPYLSENHQWWAHLFLALQILSLLILIPVSLIDYYHYIIPDSISLSGLVLGLVFSFLPGDISPLESGIGILAGGGTLYLLGKVGELLFKKESMGGGDVKLMAFIGAVWGWKIALTSIIFGSFFGALLGISLIIARIIPKDRPIPFGPYLGLGFWLSVLYGEEIIRGYFAFVEQLF